jgi:hypothetical protein
MQEAGNVLWGPFVEELDRHTAEIGADCDVSCVRAREASADPERRQE